MKVSRSWIRRGRHPAAAAKTYSWISTDEDGYSEPGPSSSASDPNGGRRSTADVAAAGEMTPSSALDLSLSCL